MADPRFALLGSRVVAAGRAVLPAWAEAVRFGAGLFETVGCELGRPLLWDAHAARLKAGLAHLGWETALPDEAAVARLLAAEALPGPAAVRVLALRSGRATRVVGLAARYLVPRRLRRDGARLRVVALPAGPLAGLKTTSYLPHRWARERARSAGADAALLLDADGAVREADSANVFAERAGRVFTPPAPRRCLPGVMRAWCLVALEREGIPVEERDLGLGDLSLADGVWLTSSLAGVVPVVAIGGAAVAGPSPILARLVSLGIPAPGAAAAGR